MLLNQNNKIIGIISPPKVRLTDEERALRIKESEQRKNAEHIKYEHFKLYSSLISIFKSKFDKTINKDVLAKLEDFQVSVEKITKYMLQDRYVSIKKKDKKKKNLKNQINPDLLIYWADEKSAKIKKQNLDPLDVIKFFKMLENFILKRSEWLYNIEELKLGQFKNTAIEVTANLPTLLLSTLTMNAEDKKNVLDFTFSIVAIYRHFKVKTLPNSKTITNPYEGEDIMSVEERWFSQDKLSAWVDSILIHWKKEDNLPKLTIYAGNASSPNSGASSSKIMEDIIAVRNDETLTDAIAALSLHFTNSAEFAVLRNTLIDSTEVPIRTFGKKDIEDALAKLDEKGNDEENLVHSRLFHFTASGGKARIIANVDWVTQTALSGIHFMLFSMLRAIKSDFTFDHKKGINYVRTSPDYLMKDENKKFFSIDLSAATDRMPRLLQSCLIEAVCNYIGLDGADIRKQWLLIVDRTYSTKGSPINEGKPIRYEVGQGMGLFTSWAIMAFMHHYIINGICKVSTDRYCLVGDDLLFFGTQDEYNKYIHIMTSIGLEVNKNKTVQSMSNENPTIEFARNFVIDGIDINPIPYGVIFAWNDEKITFENIFWHLSYGATPLLVKQLKDLLVPNLSRLEFINFLGYVHHYKIIDIFKEKEELEKIFSYPLWLTDEGIRKVFDITSPNISKRNIMIEEHGFMATFVSQCIVKKKEELIITRELGTALKLLSYVTDGMITISSYIFDRLHNSDIIKYDINLKGGPLLSKRERTLLKDLFENFA